MIYLNRTCCLKTIVCSIVPLTVCTDLETSVRHCDIICYEKTFCSSLVHCDIRCIPSIDNTYNAPLRSFWSSSATWIRSVSDEPGLCICFIEVYIICTCRNVDVCTVLSHSNLFVSNEFCAFCKTEVHSPVSILAELELTFEFYALDNIICTVRSKCEVTAPAVEAADKTPAYKWSWLWFWLRLSSAACYRLILAVHTSYKLISDLTEIVHIEIYAVVAGLCRNVCSIVRCEEAVSTETV